MNRWMCSKSGGQTALPLEGTAFHMRSFQQQPMNCVMHADVFGLLASYLIIFFIY